MSVQNGALWRYTTPEIESAAGAYRVTDAHHGSSRITLAHSELTERPIPVSGSADDPGVGSTLGFRASYVIEYRYEKPGERRRWDWPQSWWRVWPVGNAVTQPHLSRDATLNSSAIEYIGPDGLSGLHWLLRRGLRSGDLDAGAGEYR
jgi:hypothetical protein